MVKAKHPFPVNIPEKITDDNTFSKNLTALKKS